jgi:hypothetical protein
MHWPRGRRRMADGPAGTIFINYRRGDDPGTAGRLHDRLEPEFGRDNLFMDVEGHIKSGDDFVAGLEEWVTKCDVLLVVVGKTWLDMPDAGGGRRLDNPDDFVRIEIASALKQGKRVIPALVNGADMPAAALLPEPLKPLARRNAVRVTHDRFAADVHGLTAQIREFLAEARPGGGGAHGGRAAEGGGGAAGARGRGASAVGTAGARGGGEPRGEADAVGNPQGRGTGELGVHQGPAERCLRDHLARFAGGATERYVCTRLEALVWADPATQSGIAALRAFLAEFPKGDNAAASQKRLEALG